MPKAKAPATPAEPIAPLEVVASPATLMLRHDEIGADPDNDRRTFDPAELEALAATMHAVGLQQPLKVQNNPLASRHTLVMGERRWRAWGLLIESGRWPADHVELCLVETGDEHARRKAALVENASRVDLSHLEYADAFERLATVYGDTNRQMADELGRSIEFVQQHRMLIRLPLSDRARMADGKLGMHEALGIVRSTVAALEPEQRLILAEIAAAVIAQHEGKLDHYRWIEISPTVEPAVFADLGGFLNVFFASTENGNGQSRVCFYYGAEQKVAKAFPWLLQEGAAEAMQALRTEVAGAETAQAAEAEGRYLSPWLNGPFEYPPEILAANAERERRRKEEDEAWKTKRAAQDAKWKAEAAARETVEKELRASVEAFETRFRTPPAAAPLAETITARAAELEHPLPWHWDPEASEICDAAGNAIELDYHGPAAIDRLILGAVNAAAGLATPEPKHIPPPADADDDEGEDPDEGGDAEDEDGEEEGEDTASELPPVKSVVPLDDDFARQIRESAAEEPVVG